jgi:DNA-binding NtrC family response regulator
MLTKTILVLSSEEEDCCVLRSMLGDKLNVVKIKNPDEIKKFTSQASVVICDECLPGGGSWKDVHKIAQEMTTELLVVVCSHTADHDMWAEVLGHGAENVISKPFSKEEVVHVVGFAVEKRQLQLSA